MFFLVMFCIVTCKLIKSIVCNMVGAFGLYDVEEPKEWLVFEDLLPQDLICVCLKSLPYHVLQSSCLDM